ncbi:hypothetical protein LWM68_26655 [Niabella sp. W65]|nr:hypothetical protein [Niabella sp. W65]MCH7366035.1 hypothetical protein [Niabella sp. W65]
MTGHVASGKPLFFTGEQQEDGYRYYNYRKLLETLTMPIDIKALQENFEKGNFIDTAKPVWNYSILTEEDISNFQNGTNYTLYEKFGSTSLQVNGVEGMYFCVWAPAQNLFL